MVRKTNKKKIVSSTTNPMNKLIISAIAAFALLIAVFIVVKFETVRGDELGVLETFSGGVDPNPRFPKTHILIPGFTQTMYIYSMGIQTYVMNDKDDGQEKGEGRKRDSYLVQSKDQQDMRISLRVQWQRSPETLIALHKYVRDDVEERLLRPVVLNIVKNQATTRTAVEAYSGEGLVDLQKDILTALQSDPELSRFIRIHGFVIEHIGLDSNYTKPIVERQVAIQETARNKEQAIAAEAMANRAKAEAQAGYERDVVNAEKDKKVGLLEAQKVAETAILNAKAEAEKVRLAAEAENKRNVLISEGEKAAALNRAEATLALGKAEAEAQKLKLSAYAVPGAEAFVRIEVANSMSKAFENIRGYLPEKMNINLLADQYNKGVNLLVGGEEEPDSFLKLAIPTTKPASPAVTK